MSTFKGVSIATQAESLELCDFFEQRSMKGDSLELTYLRRPDFFALLKAHSDTFYVFLLRNPEGEILGAASLVVRKAMKEEKVIEVGYLGDLRIIKPRQSARIWRDFYLKLLKSRDQIEELKSIEYFYTCILDDNKKAQMALETRSPLGYHLFDDYSMVNVFFQKPFQAMSPLLQLKTDIPEEEIKLFLQDIHLTKALGFVESSSWSEWDWRKANWRDFDQLPSIGVYHDAQLIAFTKLWSPEGLKKIRLDALPLSYRWGLSLLSFLHLPRLGGEMRVSYMTYLSFKRNLPETLRQEAMRLLISQGLESSKRAGFHCVSFADFKSFSHKQAMSSYLSLETPLKFYLVDPARNPKQDFGRLDTSPGFEMGLV